MKIKFGFKNTLNFLPKFQFETEIDDINNSLPIYHVANEVMQKPIVKKLLYEHNLGSIRHISTGNDMNVILDDSLLLNRFRDKNFLVTCNNYQEKILSYPETASVLLIFVFVIIWLLFIL